MFAASALSCSAVADRGDLACTSHGLGCYLPEMAGRKVFSGGWLETGMGGHGLVEALGACNDWARLAAKAK
ncbi:hypothetical protein B1T45_07345 [Mycobacterium kansasii]|uniref:Uncharacterized protein n=2 Tax=Mycobacterium kansasii TaxID=1768 RepID=A0A1V3XXG0_MYCKA|nr:hypothetical protein MKAN_21810 [Mycobacterium kansasii ATCC 12478]ARG55698.1 hypothetical protein B1T43_07270 [Mycobacterium kansasii]EUA04912.1 hypothetical protein I547_0863 [Mycobacterium kansasii 824]ARG61140.1 hypothetical protein B1T45_07345 [Mycobacterium kansasii]ARG68843.1 hypothetical protein B1T47_07105 [Mycobacterium kansasii]